MAKATHPTSEKIAIAFDFDDTLVPDTYSGLIASLGLDVAKFREEQYEARKQQGWDAIPARFYSLIEWSKQQSDPGNKITQEYLADYGKQLQPFEGVEQMFTRLQQRITDLSPNIEIEFYLITSGFVEIARHTTIAQHFKAMWGCEFHYSETGEIECLKKSLSHPEKPRYLYFISKGVREDLQEQDLLFVYDDLPPEKLEIPLSQIIYLGDGTSDIPCFAMLNREGGIPIGVYEKGTPKEWANHYKPSQGERVANLAPADYSENSELMKSLTLAVEGICKKIELQQFSQGE